MKITSSIEDIRRQRDAYNEEIQQLNETYDEQKRAWRSAVTEKEAAIEKQISEKIGPTFLPLTIRVDTSYNDNSFRFRVDANEDHSAADGSLSWHWEAQLVNGEVKKDSGSWSGLNAVTPAQIENLKECVRVIEILCNTDWTEVLSAAVPDWDDFIDSDVLLRIRDAEHGRDSLKDNIKRAELEEVAGTDTLVAFTRESAREYMLVKRVTDKSAIGNLVPEVPWHDRIANLAETVQWVRDNDAYPVRVSLAAISANDDGSLVTYTPRE